MIRWRWTNEYSAFDRINSRPQAESNFYCRVCFICRSLSIAHCFYYFAVFRLSSSTAYELDEIFAFSHLHNEQSTTQNSNFHCCQVQPRKTGKKKQRKRMSVNITFISICTNVHKMDFYHQRRFALAAIFVHCRDLPAYLHSRNSSSRRWTCESNVHFTRCDFKIRRCRFDAGAIVLVFILLLLRLATMRSRCAWKDFTVVEIENSKYGCFGRDLRDSGGDQRCNRRRTENKCRASTCVKTTKKNTRKTHRLCCCCELPAKWIARIKHTRWRH